MSRKISSVAILGRGALGVMYADFLSNKLASDALYFLADKNRCERYRDEKLYVNGQLKKFIFRAPEELESPPDLLLVALKGPSLKEALNQVKSAVGPQTIIISVMNGISSEEIISETIGSQNILHCIAQRMDALFQKGCLTYRTFGELVIGLAPKFKAAAGSLKAVSAFFDQVEMPYVVDKDIVHRMWCKWMLNVGVNQTLAVYDDCFARVHRPGQARDTLIGAMREVLLLSQKEGTGLTEQDFKDYLQIIDELNPEGMPSMRQDRLAKRKTEVDFFAGTVISKAEKYGLEVPVNRMLLEKIRDFEREY